MTELSDRLAAVRAKGNLNFSDLHRWFDRPYPTVRSWAVGYCQPSGASLTLVLKRLEALENAVQSEPFPIPAHLDLHEHAAWFKRVVDALNRKVLRGYSAW